MAAAACNGSVVSKMESSHSRKPNDDDHIGAKRYHHREPARTHPPWQHGVAGMVSGIFTESILHPLDLVKTRMQVQRSGLALPGGQSYNGIMSAVPTIIRNEGAMALYQGIRPNLVGSGIAWGSYFTVYNLAKSTLSRHRDPDDELGSVHHLASAAVAGLATCCLTNPILMVKTRLQLQFQSSQAVAYNYKGMLDAFRRITSEEGFLALYRGLGAAMTLVSNGALQFMAYEQLKRFATDYLVDGDESKLRPIHFLAMGGVAKMFSVSITYPLQVTRSRLYQRQLPGAAATENSQYLYKSARDVWRKIYLYDGISGFYRGLSLQFMKSVPSSALTFLAYEEILRLFTESDY